MFEEKASRALYPVGEVRDVLLGPRGEVVWERPWERNLIIDGMSRAIAALIKGDPQAARVQYWAVGTGDDAWDTGTLPTDATRRSLTKLFHETARKPILDGEIKFLDGPLTGKLEIAITFTIADVAGGAANARLREFGLFAGATAAAAADSGILVNHRIHPRIDLQAGLTLNRTLRLTF